MKFIAIASITQGKIELGARIIDTTNFEIADLNTKQIEQLIKQGSQIRNLALEKGKLVWTQGVVSRYPSINGQAANVRNASSLIVLGSHENNTNTNEYVITNYSGQIKTITEGELIHHGKQYQLANCKITTKENKSHIVSISGKLDKVQSKLEFRYNADTKLLIIVLPSTGVSKLVIPESIKGNKVEIIKELSIAPETIRTTITHLVLPESLKEMRSKMFINLPNLKTLECKASSVQMRPNLFCYCRGLNTIYLKDANIGTEELFKNMKQLKDIKFDTRPLVYDKRTFQNCENINIKDLIYEGLLGIGRETFSGCTQIENVVLPKSVRRLASATFSKCTNIKSLRLTDSSLCIDMDLTRVPEEKDGESVTIDGRAQYITAQMKLLQDSPNAVLYCPYSFPQSTLDTNLANHVKVIRDKPTEEDLKNSTMHAKAALVGLRIRKSDIATNAREALGFLTLAESNTWKNKVVECIKHKTKYGNAADHIYIIENRGLCIQIVSGPMNDVKNRGMIETVIKENYAYVFDKNELTIYLIDRGMLKKRAERLIDDRLGDKLTRNTSDQFNEIDKTFKLIIPSTKLKLEKNTIDKIYEEDESLVIEYKDGKLARKMIYLG